MSGRSRSKAFGGTSFATSIRRAPHAVSSFSLREIARIGRQSPPIEALCRHSRVSRVFALGPSLFSPFQPQSCRSDHKARYLNRTSGRRCRGLAAASRFNTRMTCTACHSLRPVAVGMPRRSNSSAMARRLTTPAARSSLMIGAKSAARAWARAVRASPAARRAAGVMRLRVPRSFDMSDLPLFDVSVIAISQPFGPDSQRSKIKAQTKTGLVALEVHEIERARSRDCPSTGLNIKGG
jgi:hypothetical protein